MHKDPSQFVLETSTPSRGGGQVWAVRAEERGQVEARLEGNLACQFDEVWPEAFEVEGECIGGCVDVQGLVCCHLPALHTITIIKHFTMIQSAAFRRVLGSNHTGAHTHEEFA